MDISDLQDDEIVFIGTVVREANQKWSHKPSSQRNLEEMCKEIEDKCHRNDILIKMHLTDLLVGGQPVLEVIGKLNKSEAVDGFDHERKRHDVLKSKERNEEVLGQKERANSRKVRDK